MALSCVVIGQRLARARRLAGFTLQQIAAYLDLNREQVSDIETGQRPIDLPTLQRLADLYGFELNDFLQDTPNPESADSLTADAGGAQW